MTWLLDGNVLVAMILPDHVAHGRAHRWLANVGNHAIATCPVTEGTLFRLHMQQGKDQFAASSPKPSTKVFPIPTPDSLIQPYPVRVIWQALHPHLPGCPGAVRSRFF